jgi:uncharacterized membrane protein
MGSTGERAVWPPTVSVAGAVFLVLVTGAVLTSTSLLTEHDISWAAVNGRLLTTVCLVAGAYAWHACVTWSPREAMRLCFVTAVMSVTAEAAGLRSAVPFGARYHYHVDLLPRVPGDVPLVVPLMWFVLVYTALVLRRPDRRCRRPGFGVVVRDAALLGLYVTATDLFLDPLGTSAAAWTWTEPGGYFGTPLSNYVGWFVVATSIGVVFLSLRPSDSRSVSGDDAGRRIRSLDAMFVGTSLALTALCLAACVIRLRTLVPVLLSILAMAPYWVAWFSSRASLNEHA